MAREYRYISADGHLELKPEMWTHRVAAKYRNRAPYTITLANGLDGLVIEGKPVKYGGSMHVGGLSPDEFSPVGMEFATAKGAGPPEQRLQEQDADGIDAEILFSLGIRETSIADKNAFLAVIRGYNDWLAEEYCAVAPDRLMAVGIMPNIGADLDIAEMEHCAKIGLKTVVMTNFPSGKSYPTLEDDKFWAAALDLDFPISIHTSFPGRTQGRYVPLMEYPLKPEGEEIPTIDFVERIARYGSAHTGSLEAVQLILTGVFDRFPDLHIYWSENNIGWIPYYYEQMDRAYKMNCVWAKRILGVPILKALPSEYLKEHAYWGFFEDAAGLRMRHDVGVDRIIWSTDFPHIVTSWPHSLDLLETHMGQAGVTEEEKYKMVAGNAIRFFHLDQGSKSPGSRQESRSAATA